jgi:hypothetical protein
MEHEQTFSEHRNAASGHRTQEQDEQLVTGFFRDLCTWHLSKEGTASVSNFRQKCVVRNPRKKVCVRNQ